MKLALQEAPQIVIPYWRRTFQVCAEQSDNGSGVAPMQLDIDDVNGIDARCADLEIDRLRGAVEAQARSELRCIDVELMDEDVAD